MTRHRPTRQAPHPLVATVLTAWLLASAGLTTTTADWLTTQLRRRWRQLRTGRERGLATVELAILAAVLLGLATALLAAITTVVNKHKNQIK